MSSERLTLELIHRCKWKRRRVRKPNEYYKIEDDLRPSVHNIQWVLCPVLIRFVLKTMALGVDPYIK